MTSLYMLHLKCLQGSRTALQEAVWLQNTICKDSIMWEDTWSVSNWDESDEVLKNGLHNPMPAAASQNYTHLQVHYIRLFLPIVRNSLVHKMYWQHAVQVGTTIKTYQ